MKGDPGSWYSVCCQLQLIVRKCNTRAMWGSNQIKAPMDKMGKRTRWKLWANIRGGTNELLGKDQKKRTRVNGTAWSGWAMQLERVRNSHRDRNGITGGLQHPEESAKPRRKEFDQPGGLSKEGGIVGGKRRRSRPTETGSKVLQETGSLALRESWACNYMAEKGGEEEYHKANLGGKLLRSGGKPW